MSFNSEDDDDYFPSCDYLKGCTQDCYALCDKCSLVLCKEHVQGSCQDGHSIDLVAPRPNPPIITNTVIDPTGLPQEPTNPRNDEVPINTCEVGACKGEVFIGCPLCFRYLCWRHCDSLCANDHDIEETSRPTTVVKKRKTSKTREQIKKRPRPTVVSDNDVLPETFTVDGNRKEGTSERISIEKRRPTKGVNKQKTAKEHRNMGKEYISVKTKKSVPARKQLKERCNGKVCEKFAHQCSLITETDREAILNAFFETGSLQLQREYIVRYVKKKETKRKTSDKLISRRKYTLHYFFPKGDSEISVCKKLFLNTLGVSDTTVSTALRKVTPTGTLEQEKRGGRPQHLKNKDNTLRAAIKAHLNRFPRMESHYCRSSSSKEYLHPDLSLYKMVDMFNNEHKSNGLTTSYYTYSNEYHEMNLAIHHPKKDQCTLCNVYRTGNVEKK